jgi:fatty acid desaturase
LLALGVRSWIYLLEMYVIAVCVLSLNYNRNLAAHHYRSTGRELSHLEQLADSVNITGSGLLTELFFPLGLRYHGLHHLFPTLPYHNLGAAHRKLLAQLPAESAYHRTVYPTYWSAVRELIADARSAGLRNSASPQSPAVTA